MGAGIRPRTSRRRVERLCTSGEKDMTRTAGFFSLEDLNDPLRISDDERERAAVTAATLPDGLPVWVITRYDDARVALDDRRLSKDGATLVKAIGRQLVEAGYGDRRVSGMFELPHALFSDPPQHTRLRKLLMNAFTTKRVEALKPRFQEMTNQLVAALPVNEPVDLISQVAVPLPLAVICELLGVPDGEREPLRPLVDALNENNPDTAPAASDELAAFFTDLIEHKSRRPGDDLVSALIHVGDDQTDKLADNELLGTLFLLLNAGHDTTANLIGNALRALLQDRRYRWRLVREQPEIIPNVVEAVLAYDSPVRMATHRVVVEPVDYGGTTLLPGEIVLICLHSANRDPRRFGKHAGMLDLHRDRQDLLRHLGFGFGLHRCLGATLGRMEAHVVLDTLARAFPRAELIDQHTLRRRRSPIMNGWERLPARLDFTYR
ncbi:MULTISPECIES: cytochrome P450 [unclassified Amycolatopsis]|uniref:cytochrome P450 n=1 Tax=unclassified Amycolatopsis TaxID=2618356 RepID=UPI0028766C3B|nr:MULTISPECIES: cytochrome P450 [unclassified Amycolatopsis]MDS0140582.1 cytochrome P450 [Amycolatopsis sp. 505]MDS0149232.1 cytochrome P450 [Amycolatopsis sp. CM201R]